LSLFNYDAEKRKDHFQDFLPFQDLGRTDRTHLSLIGDVPTTGLSKARLIEQIASSGNRDALSPSSADSRKGRVRRRLTESTQSCSPVAN
jgi:hypothetical protein